MVHSVWLRLVLVQLSHFLANRYTDTNQCEDLTSATKDVSVRSAMFCFPVEKQKKRLFKQLVSSVEGVAITYTEADDAHPQIRHLPNFVHDFDHKQQSVDATLLCGSKRKECRAYTFR